MNYVIPVERFTENRLKRHKVEESDVLVLRFPRCVDCKSHLQSLFRRDEVGSRCHTCTASRTSGSAPSFSTLESHQAEGQIKTKYSKELKKNPQKVEEAASDLVLPVACLCLGHNGGDL